MNKFPDDCLMIQVFIVNIKSDNNNQATQANVISVLRGSLYKVC